MSAETLTRVAWSAELAAAADGSLPTEFRIFKYGVNETAKGSCLFDEEAAAAVMARYAKEGHDLMLDLEHHWSENSATARADAADARGWFKLELRNGELWGVDLKLTPDGVRRLTEKTQRYTSPLFLERKADSRVVRIVNVALVANPATFGAEPLVAASAAPVGGSANACHALTAFVLRRYTSREPMNPELMKKLLEIIASQDEKAALALLSEIAAASAGAPAEPATPADPLAAAADPPVPAPGEKKPEEASAATAALTALSKLAGGATEPGEIVRKLSEMSATVAKISADSAALEASERRGLVASLVKLGVELPATAWEGDPSKLVVCKRLSAEPIADLRARVETLKAARPTINLEAPPKGATATEVAEQVKALSANELKAIKDKGMTPEQFIAAKKNAVQRV